jgi:NADH-quinone oxidoreductase subunit N
LGVLVILMRLSALVQTDLKRILGFSAVAHAGYLMVGLVPGTLEGLDAAAFYTLAYIVMNFTCFWVVCREAVEDVTSPWGT